MVYYSIQTLIWYPKSKQCSVHCIICLDILYLHFEMLTKYSRVDSKRSSIIRLFCVKCTPLCNEALYNLACGAKSPQKAIERNQCTLNSLIGSTRALSLLYSPLFYYYNAPRIDTLGTVSASLTVPFNIQNLNIYLVLVFHCMNNP